MRGLIVKMYLMLVFNNVESSLLLLLLYKIFVYPRHDFYVLSLIN